MPRQPRIDHPGLLHHVLVRGIERRRLFFSDDDRNRFLKYLAEVLECSEGAKLYAWALMPNHIHLFVFTGLMPLKTMMRKLLTRYAINFNGTHKRCGHLFQNRYKSIVVDEESYFLELIRYIHLNPLHARIVKNAQELERYPYTGHSVLMGHEHASFQDSGYVLSQFGPDPKEALQNYRTFVEEGIKAQLRPDLDWGGRRRTLVLTREAGDKFICDERVLGGGSFVEDILAESDKRENERLKPHKLDTLIRSVASEYGLDYKQVLSASKLKGISNVRAVICYKAVQKNGYTVAELARTLSPNPSNVSRAVVRGKNLVKQ